MKKTHKLIIKGKIHDSLNEDQAKSMFNVLVNSEIKVKIFDKENSIFLYPYTTDVVLQKLDDIEKVIENTNLSKKQKNEIYYILENREKERQKVTEGIVQNIIDEVLKLDN